MIGDGVNDVIREGLSKELADFYHIPSKILYLTVTIIQMNKTNKLNKNNKKHSENNDNGLHVDDVIVDVDVDAATIKSLYSGGNVFHVLLRLYVVCETVLS